MNIRIVLAWSLTLLLAGIFLWAGISKISSPDDYAQTWAEWGIGAAWVYIVGILEVLGAIGLLIPKLAAIPSFCLAMLMIIAAVLCFSQGLIRPAWYAILTFVIASSVFYFRKDELIFLYHN